MRHLICIGRRYMTENEEKVLSTDAELLHEQKVAAAKERRKIRKEQEEVFTGAYLNRSEHNHDHSHSHSSHGSHGSHSHSSSRHHHRHHSSRKKKRKKRIIIGVICCVAALILGVIGSFFYLYFTGKSELNDTHSSPITYPDNMEIVKSGEYLLYNGGKYVYNNDVTSILFMGIDNIDSDGKKPVVSNAQEQTDVIYLLSVDSSNNRITVTNIPTSIMADVKFYSQSTGGLMESQRMPLSKAYTNSDDRDSGCFNTADAVHKLFYNIPVNSYYAIKMAGLATLNDSIGGIDVVAPETSGDFTQGQTYHLEGESVYSFLENKPADVNMSNNPWYDEYVTEFINKTADETIHSPLFPAKLFKKVSSYSLTNINLSRAVYLDTLFFNKSYSITTKSVPVNTKNVSGELQSEIREKEFYDIFLDTFYNRVE